MAGQYERNITLMNSIARTVGADFFALIQPHARWESRHTARPRKRASLVVPLYREITKLPKRLGFCHDLTNIFEAHDGVYREDGTHTTYLGDRIIAEAVLEVISPALEKRPKHINE